MISGNDRLQIDDDRAISCADFPHVEERQGTYNNAVIPDNSSCTFYVLYFTPGSIWNELKEMIGSLKSQKCVLQKGDSRGFAYLSIKEENSELTFAFYTNGSVWVQLKGNPGLAIIKGLEIEHSFLMNETEGEKEIQQWLKLPLNLAQFSIQQRHQFWDKLKGLIRRE